MKLSELTRCEALVLGSGIEAMVCALAQAARGRRTLLVTPFTCLYAEHDLTGDLRRPELPAEWLETLYPDDVMDGPLLHPDRLKRHGERLMARRGVSLLYACQVLAAQDGVATVAHKSGLYGVSYEQVYDCRSLAMSGADCFCLHDVKDGRVGQVEVPTIHTALTADAQVLRYETALAALPRGAELARCGTAPSRRAGLPLADAVLRGERKSPCQICREPWRDARVQEHAFYPAMSEGCVPAPDCDECDVLVVGGGTAGAAAALFAARMGLDTRLIEMNDMLGGTATIGGVSTYWFGKRSGATEQIDQLVDDCYRRYGLPRKKGLWNEHDVFLPDLKAHALLKACLQAKVDVRMGCTACAVKKTGRQVTGVYYAWRGKPMLTSARMVLDCTGDGDVCVLAGAAHVYGNEQDGMTYWGSLAQFTTANSYRNNFSTMVHVGDPLDYTRFILQGRTLGGELYDHGRYVATRETRHIQGMATVTLEDIVAMRPVEDPLYVCYSNYDPKGRLTAEMCYFGLLPPNQEIPIPRGAVIPVDDKGDPLEGLLVGGKAISCTHDALPGIRMQPDLQRQGLALAALAGCCIRQHVPAWEACGVKEAISALGGESDLQPVRTAPALEQTIESLDGTESWDWLEDSVVTVTDQVPPIIQVMTAPSAQALPLLRARFSQAQGRLKLTLARLLLWHNDETGAQTVLDAIEAELGKEGLPRRAGSVNYGQLLPDHGLMPEVVYLINSLSRAPHVPVYTVMSEILHRLENAQRDWRDLRAGIYCYCESFAWLAVRRRDAALLPLVRRVLALPELQREPDDPLMGERLHMLKLALCHAMHILGDQQGTAALQDYTKDPRRPIALAAAKLLG